MSDPIINITFNNGNNAVVATATAIANSAEIVPLLKLNDYNAVILSIGGADNLDKKLQDKLSQLFSRGIARGAAEAKSVIIDGGTDAGIMTLMGKGIAERGSKTQIIGVAPAGLVTYPGGPESGTPLEPNHSHFVLVDGNEWGAETSFLFKLVKELSSPDNTTETSAGNNKALPALVFVTGGGEVTKKEVLQAVRQGMRLIIIEGSGGFADEIATAFKKKEEVPEDPDFAEIMQEGNLSFFNIDSPVKAMQRLIVREQGIDKVLSEALDIFYLYDANAKRQQKKFSILQNWIIILGLISTALVIFQQVYGPADNTNLSKKQSADELLTNATATAQKNDLYAAQKYSEDSARILKALYAEQAKMQQQDSAIAMDSARQAKVAAAIENFNTFTAKQKAKALRFKWSLWKEPGFYWWLLHLILIAIPILIALLIAGANKFKQGNKWLKLRAGAEQIKAEMYRYRTRTGGYNINAEEKLAEILDTITHKTMDSEVSSSSLQPCEKDEDWQMTELTYLSPEKYIEVRLNNQLGYFSQKSILLEKQVNTLFWMQFAIAGAGSFLAATNMQIWVALTAALVAAIISYLNYKQTAANLLKYNLAATDLRNIKTWWNALSPQKQEDAVEIDKLVNKTETVLRNDLDSWSNRMSATIKELNKQQEKNKNQIDGLTETQNELPAGNPDPNAEVSVEPGKEIQVDPNTTIPVDPGAAISVDSNTQATVSPGNEISEEASESPAAGGDENDGNAVDENTSDNDTGDNDAEDDGTKDNGHVDDNAGGDEDDAATKPAEE